MCLVQDNAFIIICWLSVFAIVVVLGVGGRAIWSVEIFSLLIVLKWLLSTNLVNKLRNYNFVLSAATSMIIVHQIILIKPIQEFLVYCMGIRFAEKIEKKIKKKLNL